MEVVRLTSGVYVLFSLVLCITGLVLLAMGAMMKPKRIKVYRTLSIMSLTFGPFIVIAIFLEISLYFENKTIDAPAVALIVLFTMGILFNRLTMGPFILFGVDVTKVYAALDMALKRRGLAYRLDEGGIVTANPEMRLKISNQPIWQQTSLNPNAMGHEIPMAGVLMEFRRALNEPVPPAIFWTRRAQIVATGLIVLAIALLVAVIAPS